FDNTYANYSETIFQCRETTIYQGQVRVTDPSGKIRVATFEIFSQTVEPSEDTSIEQLENVLDIKLSSPQDSQDSPDSDGDHLSDYYEISVLLDPFDFDTDNDGLWDGYDDSGIGELPLGTSATNPDSDGDGLMDGLEYFGYDISINYFENTSTIHVSSDPLRTDVDLDGISDYEEYLAQSHPRLQDSDSDGLNDLDDPFPTTWDNDGDLLSDFMEISIGTDINNSDSDADGLKDGEEVNGWGIMSFKTDPTCPDSDHDFVQDGSEFFSYKVKLEDEYGKDIRVNLTNPVSLYFSKFFTKAAVAQITFALSFGEYGSDDNQTYGLEENEIVDLNVIISKPSDDLILFNSTTNNTRHYSQVVDITELMNNETLGSNYHGEYIIEAKDVNGEAIPGCLLEKFQLDFSRYLDPNCPDFDSDGIMDGVEMDLLVRGTDIIDIRDFYNCSESGTQCNSESGVLNEFSLEIPYTGIVYDASLCLEIASEDQLTGRGNVSINLVKKSIKLTEETPILLNEFQNFNEDNYFFYGANLNLSNLIERNKITEYYGNYILTVGIQSTSQNETFYLSMFSIETDTFVYAGPRDHHAWITDAALNDTDGDGWSDYYEIFVSESNPLSKDTDGDKAWDPDDRDPLRNVMIEIRPISATFWNQYFPYPTPTLQIIARFHINDLIDPDFSEESNVIGFCTTPQIASSYPTWWGAYRTAWWNEGAGHHYYFDINDDETVQSDIILFSFQLWQVLTELPDVDLFAGAWCSQPYTIGEVGHCELLEVVNNGDRVSCEVETIAIERANTIAVFDPNETVFNGHYQESERMNIIQLYVTEDGHYPGTISFEHELNGSLPINWAESQGWLDQSNSGQNPYITDEIDGHSKVLQFHDTNPSGRGYLTHQWDESYITGQLECWVRLTSNSSRAYIIIRDGSDSNSIFLRFDSTGYIQCRDGNEYYSIKTYNANEWYHLRFKWNCNDDWHLWINGQNKDIPVDIGRRITRGFEFYGTPLAMNELSIQTDSVSNDYSFYVDAVGYSFDPYYSIGDNLIRSDSTGTPFQPGLNIIVIPTALFSHTLLNSYFQSEQLYKTPLYSDEEGIFDFYSIDRDGNIVDDQCGDTDFVFIRYDLLAQEAMEILNSLLTCAINQSVDNNNETVTKFARVLEYASTKINGTKAVMMNLPQGLLSFIPWISDFVNSPYGDTPTAFNFLGLLLGGILILLFPLAGIVITIFVTIALFSVMFRDIARTIGMAILTFLAKLLWILIRVALLIFFFIMLALEIIITVPLFLAMGISFALFSLFLDMDVQFGVNCIPLYGQDTRIGHVLIDIRGCNFLLEAWVKWIYWEFFDLFIPYVDMNLELDSDSPLTNPPEDPSNGIGTFLTCGFDQLSEYKFNFHTIYWDTPYNTPPE
ncbi:MAG: LamG-like jellyroll fold domain-containing protein, partial [Promethearchaeota archaeon]